MRSESEGTDEKFQQVVDYVARQRAAGREVDHATLRSHFAWLEENKQEEARLDSILSIPDWFSEPSVDQLPADLPRNTHQIHVWGEYLLLEEVGRGGMGQVFKAWDLKMRRFVALKRLRSDRESSEGVRKRFREEPKHVRKLDHPAIVPVFDVGEVDGCPYFTMELIQGTSLVHFARHQALPSEQIAEMMLLIAESVQTAHHAGVLHRDLKPANVLLSTDLAPRLVDFGLAKDIGSDSDLTGSLVLGTLNYMSPEQSSGTPADERTDVYGLGAVLYELLTARPPFRGATVSEMLYKVQHEDPTSPRQISATVDPRLEAICLKCLEKDPQRRYQSADDVRQEFQRVIDGKRQRAPLNTFVRRLYKRARQHPAASAASVLLLVALSLGVATVSSQRLAYVRSLEMKIAEQKREEAERRERLTLALSYELDANSMFQQGRWTDALPLYRKAIDSGHPTPLSLEIEVAKCFLFLDNADKSEEVLRTVLDQPELSPSNRATARLWLGNLLLGHDDDAAFENLRAAEKQIETLEVADQHFLKGLLADRLSTAADHFRAAVDRASHHIEARRMLAVCLVFSGRVEECETEIRVCLAFAPKDVPLIMLQAVTTELRGEHEKALRLVATAKGTPYEEQIPFFEQALNLIHDFGTPQEWTAARNVQFVIRLAPFLVTAAQSDAAIGRRVPMPPAISNVFRPMLQQLATSLTFGNRQGLRETLEKATSDVREGTLLYLLGRVYVDLGDLERAHKAFEDAKSAPCFVNLIDDVDYYLARTCWGLSFAKEPEEAAALREQSLHHIREFVRQEKPSTISAYNFMQLAEVAFQQQDTKTALAVVSDWPRRFGMDAQFHRLMGVTMLKEEKHLAALGHFRMAVSMGATDSRTQSYIAKCEERIAETEE